MKLVIACDVLPAVDLKAWNGLFLLSSRHLKPARCFKQYFLVHEKLFYVLRNDYLRHALFSALVSDAWNMFMFQQSHSKRNTFYRCRLIHGKCSELWRLKREKCHSARSIVCGKFSLQSQNSKQYLCLLGGVLDRTTSCLKCNPSRCFLERNVFLCLRLDPKHFCLLELCRHDLFVLLVSVSILSSAAQNTFQQ